METALIATILLSLTIFSAFLYLLYIHKKLSDSFKTLELKKNGFEEAEKILLKAKSDSEKIVNDALARSSEIIKASQAQAENLLSQAGYKSQEIFKEASQKAGILVTEAGQISQEIKEKLNSDLNNASKDYLESLNITVQKINDYSANLLASLASDIDTKTIAFVDSFSKNLTTQSIETSEAMRTLISNFQKNLSQEIEKQRSESFAEIEKAKDFELKKFENNILEIIKQTSSKVVADSLDENTVKNLVITAIEDAKQRNIF